MGDTTVIIKEPVIQDPRVKRRPKLKKPNLFAVILINDDFTTMEFVIYVLKTIFEKSDEDAMQIMLNVHQKGRGTAGIYPFQIAEQKAYETAMAAQANEYPLQVELDEIDS
jgi:ATP-dependent Clp protease adaptor protein ClpS